MDHYVLSNYHKQIPAQPDPKIIVPCSEKLQPHSFSEIMVFSFNRSLTVTESKGK